MTSEELDQQVRQLTESTRLIVDPDDELSQAFIDNIISAPRNADSPAESAGLDTDVVVETQWLDNHVEQSPDSQARRRLLLVAAAVALIAVLGSMFVFSSASLEQLDVAATPEDGEEVQPPEFEIPEEPIRGLDEPLFIINHGGANGFRCAQFSFPVFLGHSPIAEAYLLPEGIGGFEPVEYVDFGDGFAHCDGSAAQRGGGYFCCGDATHRYLPSEVPTVLVGGGGGDDQSNIYFDGHISNTVDSVRLIFPEAERQLFRKAGNWFRVDLVAEGIELFDEDLEGEVQLEITFNDGTVEIQRSFAYFTDDCSGDLDCTEAWFATYLAQAEAQDASAQAAALEDFNLTQVEYDRALAAFRDCAPSGSELSIVAESPEAQQVRECFDEHVSFVEQARALTNSAGLAAAVDADADARYDSAFSPIPDARVFGVEEPVVTLSENEKKLALQALGFYNYSTDELEEKLTADRLNLAARDELIIDCMQQAGFSYFPRNPEFVIQQWSGFEHQFGTELWAERYGFGLTTLTFLQEDLSPPLVGAPMFLPVGDASEESRQSQYLEGLGEDEQDAYHQALARDTDSCEQAARESVPTFAATGRIDVSELDTEALRQRILDSDEYGTAELTATICLSTAGYDALNEDEAIALVNEQVSNSGLEDEDHFQDQGDSVSLSPEGEQLLVELQAFEIELAGALWDCGATSRQLNSVAEGVALRLVSEQIASQSPE